MQGPPHLRLARDLPPDSGADLLEPTDPRWVIAVAAHTKLQGDSLPAPRREAVLVMARRLGLSSFEARAIVAVVEDLAHHQRPIAEARPLLAAMRDPRRRTWSGARVVAILVTAVMAAVLTVRWVF